jgi:PPOX class probable F420-dependent enzyme
MPSGSVGRLRDLPIELRSVIDGARRAVLTTVDADGPHSVPVCFAVLGQELVTAIDHKPKAAGTPARLRNVRDDPAVTLLIDRWDEDWERLAWVMVRGRARIEPPGTGSDALLARYPQYGERPPSGDAIVIAPHRILWWAWEAP